MKIEPKTFFIVYFETCVGTAVKLSGNKLTWTNRLYNLYDPRDNATFLRIKEFLTNPKKVIKRQLHRGEKLAQFKVRMCPGRIIKIFEVTTTANL